MTNKKVYEKVAPVVMKRSSSNVQYAICGYGSRFYRQ